MSVLQAFGIRTHTFDGCRGVGVAQTVSDVCRGGEQKFSNESYSTY